MNEIFELKNESVGLADEEKIIKKIKTVDVVEEFSISSHQREIANIDLQMKKLQERKDLLQADIDSVTSSLNLTVSNPVIAVV